ncbi:CdaR family transcriptional regulator [Nocardia panacis]|uniref:CdaR family transcriptional regulator n=1 Tax=Nocardia panacis TaxID=2340916 RepID=A0A3A4K1G6_9NOCA|nr:helix-turn-helix domain-containing protein [Nocardia panacis]RJO73570.1 CdaR family transcriptional regulator [Nocardia panacis]
MSGELQQLVDNAGRRLGRSVAIDDAKVRLLAYNAHAAEVDAVRVGSILRREVPPELVAYIYASGAGTAEGMFVLQPNDDLGVEVARYGMPIRYGETLLGFVWLLASDGAVGPAQERLMRSAADAAADLLHRGQLRDRLTRARESELVRDLLGRAPELRDRAATQLAEEALLAPGPALVLTVLLTGVTIRERDRLALAVGTDRLARRLPRRHAIPLDRPDHSLILVSLHDAATRADLDTLAEALRERVLRDSGRAHCWIGLGTARDDPADLHESYTESRRAAEVARAVRTLGSVVRHQDLGVYALLSELSPERLQRGLPAGLQALLVCENSNRDALIETLECFLDYAGDIKRTTDRLRLHRGSLYYRLRRIEEITGTDLASGEDRLALHLGLKTLRLLDVR